MSDTPREFLNRGSFPTSEEFEIVQRPTTVESHPAICIGRKQGSGWRMVDGRGLVRIRVILGEMFNGDPHNNLL